MTAPDVPEDLHPDVAVLAPLLGTWRGEGHGEYPTIAPFGYHEEVAFGYVPGKPFLTYAQRTRAADDGRPLHAETGYWRVPAPDRCEIVLAHPTGVTEVAEGAISGEVSGALVVAVTSRAVGLTATAKHVSAVERRFEVSGDTLGYTLAMAAVGQPMTHHLAATLHRAPPG